MDNTFFSRPVLISGIAFGVITTLPPFSFINFCTCCSLYAATGFLAAYLARKESATALTTGAGAMTGLAAGVWGGIVGTLFSIPIFFLLQSLIPVNSALIEGLLEGLGDPSNPLVKVLRDLVSEQAAQVPAFTVTWILMKLTRLIWNVLWFSVFSTLGGVLAIALLEKRAARASYVPPASPPGGPQAPPPPVPPAPPE